MSSAPVPPQKGNNAVWWILGVIAGGIAVMVLFGLVLAGVIIRHVHVNEDSKKVEIQTPVGELRVNKNATHASGLPVFPGAEPKDNKGGSADLLVGDEGLGFAGEEFQTSEEIGTVRSWYRKRLGPEFREETEDKKSVKKSGAHFDTSDSDFAFVDDKGDGARVVALKKNDDGTEISLFRMGSKETQ